MTESQMTFCPFRLPDQERVVYLKSKYPIIHRKQSQTTNTKSTNNIHSVLSIEPSIKVTPINILKNSNIISRPEIAQTHKQTVKTSPYSTRPISALQSKRNFMPTTPQNITRSAIERNFLTTAGALPKSRTLDKHQISKNVSKHLQRTVRYTKNAFEFCGGIEAFTFADKYNKSSFKERKQTVPKNICYFEKPKETYKRPQSASNKCGYHKIVAQEEILIKHGKKRNDDIFGSNPDSEINPDAKVMMLKSIYEGRKPTIFFPYPPCCLEERNPLDRIFIYQGPIKPSYRLTDSIYAYNSVINSLQNAGLTETQDKTFNVIWSAPLKPKMLQNLTKHQKCNHFPKTWQLGGKDNLWKNVSNLKRKFGDVYEICPKTFIMPEDYERFKTEYENNPKSLWILKPVASSCGRGIKIIIKGSSIPKRPGYLVSKYIANPHLINGFKYDLRVYALVTSYDPLRIYMYDNGLVRFCTEPYTTSVKSCKSRCVHLTNYAVNKKAEKFIKNENPEEDGVGSKWSFIAYRKKLSELGIDHQKLFKSIKDVIIKACISAETAIFNGIMQSCKFPNQCFELYGFDILIDAQLKPWLMEVNVSPSLSSSSPMDKKIKTRLMCDVFNIIGIQIPNMVKVKKTATNIPKQKAQARCRNINELLSLEDFKSLAKEDIEILINSEEEYHRRGHFERIFPESSNIDYYGKFFETLRYNNVLLWRWIKSKPNFLEELYTKLYKNNC